MRIVVSVLTLSMAFVLAAQMAQASTEREEPASAEESFKVAMEALQSEADRSKVAALFRATAEQFPNAPCVADAQELARLLDAMAREDEAWVEPESLEGLSTEEQSEYYTHRLRDVAGHGWDHVVWALHLEELPDGSPNPAGKLRDMGDGVIPALLAMLDDPRPTRAVWHHRHARYWSVLRYQDVAIQILETMTPAPFYRISNTATYFSSEAPAYQAEIQRQLRTWWEKADGKPEPQRMWAAIETGVGIYPTLAILEELAFEHQQRPRVQETLRLEALRRPRIQLPQLSYLMCRLGDTSYMDEAWAIWKNRLHGRMIVVSDDACPISNAQDYVYKQLILYGEHRHRHYLSEILHGRENEQPVLLVRVLCDLASDRWDQFPKEYDREGFPVDLLVDALSAKAVREPREGSGHMRLMEEVVLAIQTFTGRDFGLERNAPIEVRDRAVADIKTWWETEQ